MSLIQCTQSKTLDAHRCIGRFVVRSSRRAAPTGPCYALIPIGAGFVEFLELKLGGVKRRVHFEGVPELAIPL